MYFPDDNFLIAPSRKALQEMLDTCNEYAKNHNLKFSTDPNPIKSKTKCLKFLMNEREISKLKLGNDLLPWVTNGKHLGNNLENIINGLKKDMSIKRARYIDRNNELQQEFFFAHPETKVKVNRIYNTHFTGSPLWDLFSRESEMIENTYNVSIRAMFDIPRQTHKYFIEPLTQQKHLKALLIRRFLSFIEQIKKCPKDVVKVVLNTIKHDVASTTGSNLRNILLMMGKDNPDDLCPEDSNLVRYHPIPEEESWRLQILTELLNERQHNLNIEGFTTEELDDLVHIICTS